MPYVISLINAERSKVGLSPLAFSPSLAAAADAHCMDMVESGKLSHYGTDGSTWADRADRAGYPGASLYTVSEVIAQGQTTEEQVVRAWMSDRPHREVILFPHALHAGSACRSDSRNTPYWTVDLGWATGPSPTPTPAPKPPNPRPRPTPTRTGWWTRFLKFLQGK